MHWPKSLTPAKMFIPPVIFFALLAIHREYPWYFSLHIWQNVLVWGGLDSAFVSTVWYAGFVCFLWMQGSEEIDILFSV